MIIYRIHNIINFKDYIGQTIYDSFNKRYKGGKWWDRANIWLFEDFILYGAEHFEIFIIESDVENQDLLNEYETKYIKEYDCIHPKGYNIKPGGNHGPHHQDTKDKISKIFRKGKPYKLKSPDGEIVEFFNLRRFAEEHKLDFSTLKRMIKGKFLHCGRWTLPDTILRAREIRSPEGKSYSILDGDIRAFCREHGLMHGPLIKVFEEKHSHHRGWVRPDSTMSRDEAIKKSQKPKQAYDKNSRKFVSPSGEIIEVEFGFLKAFYEKYNLTKECMRQLMSGKKSSYKGWKKFQDSN